MLKAVSKEGPRAPLFYGVMVLACGGLVHAQSVDLADLEICAGLETEALKLACFEAIIATGRVESERPLEPDAAPGEPLPERAAKADSPPTQANNAPTADAESAASAIPAATAASTVDAAPVAAAPSSEAQPENFGDEHLRKEADDAPEVLHATVIKVTSGRLDALVFHLDNGQIWRQIEPRFFPYPKSGEFDVEISTGMMGEYRLQVGGSGRKVRIKRTK